MGEVLAKSVASSEFCADKKSSVVTLKEKLAQVFELKPQTPDTRAEIEAFIQHCFHAAHGANVDHFMPQLYRLCSKRGELIAAFGLREASKSNLFLENYLERPIDETLSRQLGRDIRREDIIEVGNLSALYPGAVRWLIVALTAMLYDQGYKWVVFTGTAVLRNGFRHLGLVPLELGHATLAHLPPEERADWGSYYDHAPKVMAGDIDYGYHSLLAHRELARVLRAGMDSVPVP